MAGRSIFATLTALSLFATALAAPNSTSCTYIPGDEEWPSPEDWKALNSSVDGRLIATVPQASVCHVAPFGDYNEDECQALQSGWTAAQSYEPYPADMMNAYYQNQSCDPWTPSTQPCELGNYAAYSISVTGADDVVAGIKFAQEKNIRLVVKTTGHDYNGRSSGHGALALWTWNLKTSNVIPEYTSSGYSGPAMKLGSGMIVGDAYAAAHEAGYRIVGGECGSVGIASGYTQGGGHSMLNTAYGMAADQVLEWEVVAPTGQYLTATPEQNSDLYWALSGGGGGTYGIVLSMTVKIYPDGPVAGGSLTFAKTNESAYWKAVGLWFQQTPRLVQDNNTLIFLVQDDGFGVVSMTLPDRPESAVATLLQPYLDELDDLGIVYNLTTTYFEYYLEHFAAFFGPLPYGPNDPSGILINRIIPRSIVESDSSTAQLMDAFKDTVSGGDFLVGCSVMNVANTSWTSNAVLPAWRNTSVACNVNGHWNYTAPLATNINTKRRLTEVHMPAIEAASPGGGVYLNEMDPFYRNPDWKGQLFGENYEGLLQVKDKYDPQRVLWGNFSVASDEKVLDGSGRLCKLPIS